MNKFTISIVTIVTIWMLTGVKFTVDQLKLYRAYKTEIDPTFPAETTDVNPLNAFSILKWRLRVIFSRYPNNPNVDKLARRVQVAFFSILILFVAMMISFVVISQN